MLRQIVDECLKKPYLNDDEAKEIISDAKKNGIAVGELGEVLGLKRNAWWSKRKKGIVPRVLAILIELADKAQKYEEIKKI